MKTTKAIVLGLAALGWAGASLGQTTVTTPSVRDNPGTLGMPYGQLNYTWHDMRDNPSAYDIAGVVNVPALRGLDLQFGYDYFWWNDSHDPTTVQDNDYRLHTLRAGGRIFAFDARGVRPFLSGGVGYQWSRGDIDRLRTYDDRWLFDVTGGVEIAMGGIALTPFLGYRDLMHSDSIGVWHMGGEAHTWFNERVGGFANATFYSPRTGGGPDHWSYTGGLRFRF